MRRHRVARGAAWSYQFSISRVPGNRSLLFPPCFTGSLSADGYVHGSFIFGDPKRNRRGKRKGNSPRGSHPSDSRTRSSARTERIRDGGAIARTCVDSPPIPSLNFSYIRGGSGNARKKSGMRRAEGARMESREMTISRNLFPLSREKSAEPRWEKNSPNAWLSLLFRLLFCLIL